MPIAIFRHLKLTVALPLEYRPTILNFSPRRLHGLYMDQDIDDTWIVRLKFSRLMRRKGLLSHYNQTWHFHHGEMHVLLQYLRNGRAINESSSLHYPAYSLVWTDNGLDQLVYNQIEEEIASQVIVERYLHEHIPNPYGYRIVQMDFNPQNTVNGRPAYTNYSVRSPQAVELAAAMEHLENAKEWEELFLS